MKRDEEVFCDISCRPGVRRYRHGSTFDRQSRTQQQNFRFTSTNLIRVILTRSTHLGVAQHSVMPKVLSNASECMLIRILHSPVDDSVQRATNPTWHSLVLEIFLMIDRRE